MSEDPPMCVCGHDNAWHGVEPIAGDTSCRHVDCAPDSCTAFGYVTELVMPFVVCASNGGPYDDDSFAAGWWCGMVDEAMQHARLTPGLYAALPVPVPEALAPQLDLISMRHGYTMHAQPAEDELMYVTFQPTKED